MPSAPDLERGDRLLQVVDRAGRAREVEHRVQRARDVDVLGDVVLHEAEAPLAASVREVVRAAGDEVVHRRPPRGPREEAVGEMRAEEAGPARDQTRMSGYASRTDVASSARSAATGGRRWRRSGTPPRASLGAVEIATVEDDAISEQFAEAGEV